VVVLKVEPDVQTKIRAIRDWHAVDEMHAVGEFQYQPRSWAAPRRVVVLRQVEPEGTRVAGRKLIDVPGYTFRVFITSMELPAVEVWRFYDSRADCENRIKELKFDFGAAGFCLNSFEGTDAVFRLVCFLFNLLAQFKQAVTGDTKPQLNTLRTQLLVVGAILGADGRQQVLRLGLRSRQRARFAEALERLDDWPTASQRDIFAELQGLSPQSDWRARREPPRIRAGPHPLAAAAPQRAN
jgi:hypothetical protein